MIKRRIGGKYVRIRDANGYYGNNDAGNKQEKGVGGTPDKRAFKGSGIQEFVFTNTLHGTHTIPAHSFTEALRIAESLGYTRADYKRKRGN